MQTRIADLEKKTYRKPYKKFDRKRDTLTVEQKIEKFVLRNSDNGYFTRISTITHKFGITQDRMWQVVGELLVDGNVESVHDESSGEMKLCRTGKTYEIMGMGQKRRNEKRRPPRQGAGGRSAQ